jgi:RNA polymerase sigma-70 factor (ECF subfamily)
MAASPAELFDRHHLAIFRYLLRMTGRKDVAEDLTQDVFVRVLRAADASDLGNLERAWLFRVARNLLIDWQRRAARNPVASTLEDSAGSGLPFHGAQGRQAGTMSVSDPRPDVALDIRAALERLPEADRDAFLLRVVGGLGHEEIASISGATAASVRSRIFRARSALRATLAPELPGRAGIGRLKVVP